MLLVLPQKENANQDVLILLIMDVYLMTLFTLTFCRCGPVFLSLLGTLVVVGSAGVVL